VGEFICLASLFTTLKYYPSDSALFAERVVRYGCTLGCAPGDDVVFEYISIRKDRGRFEFLPIAEFSVDLGAGTVTERVLDPSVSARSASPVSPVHAGLRPGTYAPARNS
jgi:hypothetical protein